jgi:hypothetical protein
MKCEDHDRLLRECVEAIEEASRADTALTEIGGRLPLAEYRVLLIEFGRCQEKEAKTRIAFREHVQKHRCQNGSGTGGEINVG